jgi:hypothetical protein
MAQIAERSQVAGTAKYPECPNKQKARTMLAEIYNWFTGGFDTADLKEAQGAPQRIKRLG